MTAYPADEFLLRTEAARRVYREIAVRLPIVDYHCHLDPVQIARNEPLDDIVALWIAGDPYKWRAMRINGIPERCITGDASAPEKFAAWAATLPRLVGNPLFHWSAMELKQFFGVEEVLSPGNAERIRKACEHRLASGNFRPRTLLSDANVETLCTSDLWTDSLSHHERLSQDTPGFAVLPSLRADRALTVDLPDYHVFLSELSEVTRMPIHDWESFRAACICRLDAFGAAGCRLVDIGLDSVALIDMAVIDGERIDADDALGRSLLASVLSGDGPAPGDAVVLRSTILAFLASECARRDWVLQLHIGAQRYTSTRLRSVSGLAGGYACIGSSQPIEPMCRLLDTLDQQDSLPRTILYPLNPSDTEMWASLTGSFSEDGVAGKIQLGPAWWYNDHADGIARQLRAIAAYGALGRFIGMTTDSRSLLSTVRHDYFRRVFCSLLGEWIESKSLPDDDALLRGLIEDVCYRNARQMLQGATQH